MITIQILEADDVILETDFCRPLLRSADRSQSDMWMPTNMYSGAPEDHLQWAHVYNVLGPIWFGKKLSDYLLGDLIPMEFVRGRIPEDHILHGKFPDFRNFKAK